MNKNEEILNALDEIEIIKHPRGNKFSIKKGNEIIIVLQFITNCKCDTCKEIRKRYENKWFAISQEKFYEDDYVKVFNSKGEAFNFATKWLRENVN